MSRYIALRVAQLKANQQAISKKPQGKVPLWLGALQLFGMFLLMKLIGPLPGVLAVLAYVWMKPKFGMARAAIGATAVGSCLTIAASMLLPKEMLSSGNGNAALRPAAPALTNQPNPFDQVDPPTARSAAPHHPPSNANPFRDPNYGRVREPSKFSFEEAKGGADPQPPE